MKRPTTRMNITRIVQESDGRKHWWPAWVPITGRTVAEVDAAADAPMRRRQERLMRMQAA